MNLVTIIPPDSKPGNPSLASGTRVVLADGSELQGITRLSLSCEPGDVWRAEIHCLPRLGELSGVVADVICPRPKWWRRALCRIAGVKVGGA